MHRSSLSLVCAILTTAVAMLGCQGGPTLPNLQGESGPPASTGQTNPQGHQCLGLYAVVIDTRTCEAEVIPARTGEWHFNLTGVLNTTLGVSAAAVPSESDPTNGLFVLDITLSHPFGTKPQFAGFDVKGILITPGSLAIGSLLFADTDETRLENADGYTRWWNPTEFKDPGIIGYTEGILANAAPAELTATINPYKYFADILGPEAPMSFVYNEPLENDQGRGVFTAGSSNTRRYRIRFPMDPGPKVVFGYAIDASWAQPDPNPPGETPDDFPIEANQPEAYNMVVAPKVNSLYYNTHWARGGGVLRLQVNVHDWQGQQQENIANEVEVVRVFSPDLFSSGVDAIFLDETATKARYTADIWGMTEPTKAGKALVAVRAGSKGGPAYDQGFGGSAAWANVSAWRVIEVEVTDPDCQPDSNNWYGEAVDIGLETAVVNTMCVAADSEDWYKIQVPPGYVATGWIRFVHDGGTQELTLNDSSGAFIAPACNHDGYSEISFGETWPLEPKTYCIKCAMINDVGAVLYTLETNLQLTDVRPTNPVDVSPDYLDLDAFWLYPESADDAYIAGYAGTWAFDTTHAPFMLSRTRDPLAATPACYPPYIYYWENWADDPAGIDLVDYTSKAYPVLHEDVLVFPHQVEFMTMNSEHLFVAVDSGTNTWVHIYDYATDPTSPELLNIFEVPHNQRRMALWDPEGPVTALVTMNNTTMRLFDVEDPMSVTQKDSSILLSGINTALDVHSVYIAKTHYDGVSQSYLEVYKYAPVAGLTFWGSIAVPSVPESLAIQGTHAYIPSDGPSVKVVDYTSKLDLTFGFETPAVSGVSYLDTVDDKLFAVLDGAGIAVYDISTPDFAEEWYRTKCLNNPRDGAVRGDYIYFIERSGLYGALMVIDIAEPSSPLFAGEYILGERPVCMAQYGNLLGVGADNRTFYLFNITDPLNCQLVLTDTYGAYVDSVGMSGHAIYVPLSNSTMKVYNIAGYPTITPMPDVPLPDPDPAGDIVIYPDKMYIARLGTNLFWQFNISDEYHPYYTGANYGAPSAGNLHEMTRQWTHMYVCYDDGLVAYDLAMPMIVDILELPYAPNFRHIAVGGQFAYLSDDNNSPVVVSIWNPDQTELFGEPFGDPPGFQNMGMIADKGHLYMLHRNIGIRVFDLY